MYAYYEIYCYRNIFTTKVSYSSLQTYESSHYGDEEAVKRCRTSLRSLVWEAKARSCVVHALYSRCVLFLGGRLTWRCNRLCLLSLEKQPGRYKSRFVSGVYIFLSGSITIYIFLGAKKHDQIKLVTRLHCLLWEMILEKKELLW